MKRPAVRLFVAIIPLFLLNCTNLDSSQPRTLTLNNQAITENETISFVTWKCKDFVFGWKVKYEVGVFENLENSQIGFILFDGTDTGDLANYCHQGNLRHWGWENASAILEPDNTLLYYDLTDAEDGETKQASKVYKCKQ